MVYVVIFVGFLLLRAHSAIHLPNSQLSRTCTKKTPLREILISCRPHRVLPQHTLELINRQMPEREPHTLKTLQRFKPVTKRFKHNIFLRHYYHHTPPSLLLQTTQQAHNGTQDQSQTPALLLPLCPSEFNGTHTLPPSLLKSFDSFKNPTTLCLSPPISKFTGLLEFSLFSHLFPSKPVLSHQNGCLSPTSTPPHTHIRTYE